MLAYRLAKERWAGTALDGSGAKAYGGRWNSPGTAILYASESIALAALELLVHLRRGRATSCADNGSRWSLLRMITRAGCGLAVSFVMTLGLLFRGSRNPSAHTTPKRPANGIQRRGHPSRRSEIARPYWSACGTGGIAPSFSAPLSVMTNTDAVVPTRNATPSGTCSK
jgi:RES domain